MRVSYFPLATNNSKFNAEEKKKAGAEHGRSGCGRVETLNSRILRVLGMKREGVWSAGSRSWHSSKDTPFWNITNLPG